MPAATNQQVQTFVNERMRPFCEMARALKLASDDNAASIGDVYANLTNSPNWTDVRTDGPPSLLAPDDVLAWNAFMYHFKKIVEGAPEGGSAAAIASNWATILKACVRPV